MKRVLCFLLCTAMLSAIVPITVTAGHSCPGCGEWIDGDIYCKECYYCDACVNVCATCEKCDDCENDICFECSNEVVGEKICIECAIDAGYHCTSCGGCYIVAGLWCEECGICAECESICTDCADAAGEVLCLQCALDGGYHCPGCDECFVTVGVWCDVCGLCDNCSSICEYCSSELGQNICAECAKETELHCPDCGDCYDEVSNEYCYICGVCSSCKDICIECVSDGICIDCAIDEGYHCSGCGECGANVIICDDCGQMCSDCAYEFCDNCALCSDCVFICPDCWACEECADICENCREHCSNCTDICSDCGFCEICCQGFAEYEGCDCSQWVCVNSLEWDEHFANEHSGEVGDHAVFPALYWTYDTVNHWRKCLYCNKVEHVLYKSHHSYNESGKCTVCGYYEGSIKITEQPQNVTNAVVSDANSDYLDNVARFRVKAEGNGKLTYQWLKRHVGAGGTVSYVPMSDPSYYENFTSSTLTVVVPTDACYEPLYVRCLISDSEGHSIMSDEVYLKASHSYSYWLSDSIHVPLDAASSNSDGHVLACVGEGCDAVTEQRKHYDKDADYICDVCEHSMDKTLKMLNIVYDEAFAFFKVGDTEKKAEINLKYALKPENTAYTDFVTDLALTELCHYSEKDNCWYAAKAAGTLENVINTETKYAACLNITGTLKQNASLPAREVAEKIGFFYLNGKIMTKSNFTLRRYIQDGDKVEISIYIHLTPGTQTPHKITVENGACVSSFDYVISSAFSGVTLHVSTGEDDVPTEGEVFLYWECVEGGVTLAKANKEYTSFVMPDRDVVLRAVYGSPSDKAKIGDVDNNGKINISDVVLMLKYISKWNVTIYKSAADTDVNGIINLSDAVLLLKYIAGWNVKLG